MNKKGKKGKKNKKTKKQTTTTLNSLQKKLCTKCILRETRPLYIYLHMYKLKGIPGTPTRGWTNQSDLPVFFLFDFSRNRSAA